MKIRTTIAIIIAITLTSITNIAGAHTNKELKYSRDSLEIILRQIPANNGVRRLEVLNHLFDIDVTMGKNTYLMPLWQEAVALNDVNSMDDILVPVVMSYRRKEMNDSALIWEGYNKKYITGPRGECNAEYLKLMRDISNWKEYDKLVERILKEKVSIDAKAEPYRAMRILYTLGIISNFEKANNSKRSMKPGKEYMVEALGIAREQPFRESLRFQRQILLGLGSEDVEYARQYLQFAQRFFAEPDISKRPFYSRRTLISAYDKLITSGEKLSRTELDTYYNKLTLLIKQYPSDVVGKPEYFNARLQFRYNMAIHNDKSALMWCDSLIAYSQGNGISACYYIGDKMRLLGKLERWQEGYQVANEYMQIKDSLTNATNQEKLSELQTQYEVDKLSQEAKLRRNQLTFAVVCGALLLLLLLVYIVYSLRLKRRNLMLYRRIREQESAQLKVTELRNSLPEEQQTKEEQLFGTIYTKIWETKPFTDSTFDRDALTNLVGSNRTYVADAIRSCSEGGQSVMEFINDQRLKYACSLLETSNASIESIAIDSGFASTRTFFRQFKATYELTPTEYRRISRS